MWYQFARVVGELRPKWVVVENVASGAKRWVDAVVRDLGQLGYEVLPIPIAAEDVGAPHRRARIFLVARRVPDAVGGQVWDGQQWGPGGRSGGVRDAGGDSDLAHAHGQRQPEPHHEAQAERGGEPQGTHALGGGAALALAHDHGHGLEEVGLRGAVEGGAGFGGDDLPAYGYDAHGRCGPRPWPPGPGDLAGWEDWIAAGGPVPALLRSPDGRPCGMARREWGQRLKAMGNAVVPQCVEVVGWVIRELEGF